MKHVHTIQLTNEWVILVIHSLEDVVDRIDSLSGGKFLPDIKKYVDSLSTERIDFNARARFFKLRDTHIAQARIDVGEQDLDLPSTFTPQPIEMGRCLVGINGTETMGGPNTEYVHYCYLRVPKGTKNIHISSPKIFPSINVNIDLTDYNVSRAIKVNQVGYLLDAPKKYAYLGAHVYDFGPLTFEQTQFNIIDVYTENVVYTGNITLVDSNYKLPNGKMLTGENVYELDFSSFTTEGEFQIEIPGVGRSWKFKHSNDVYGEVFYTNTRGLYHQRCGIELKKPFTHWTRIKCHTKPICESKYVSFPSWFQNKPANYNRFDVYGATIDTSSTVPGAFGGWHDAADWDRNTHHYTCIFDMLYTYEMNPSHFVNDQLNIPESKNISPDILDEVNYGLSIWRRSMKPDGGISGMVETDTHPGIETDGKYAYSVRTRWDSLLFAAGAAMYAQMMKPFDEATYNQWIWYAKKAYNYGINPKNSLGTIKIPARKDRGAGEYYEYEYTESDEQNLPLLIHAKTRLFKATGDVKYLDGVIDSAIKLRNPFGYPYTTRDYIQWIHYSVLDLMNSSDKEIYIKKWFLNYANNLIKYSNDMPYKNTWIKNRDFWLEWGCSNMVNENRALIISYKLTNDIKYKEIALLNYDFMLGANPMGMCWTTGLGYVYPVHFQSDLSNTDNILDPIPGITVYGLTGGSATELKNLVWRSPSPNGPVDFKVPDVPIWRTYSAHPKTNTKQAEYTLQETFACNIFCSGFLMSDGWKPSKELKERLPKNKENLHGLYYLP